MIHFHFTAFIRIIYVAVQLNQFMNDVMWVIMSYTELLQSPGELTLRLQGLQLLTYYLRLLNANQIDAAPNTLCYTLQSRRCFDLVQLKAYSKSHTEPFHHT